MEGFTSWFTAGQRDGSIPAGVAADEFVDIYCQTQIKAVKEAVSQEWQEKLQEARRTRDRSGGRQPSAIEEKREARDALRALGKSIIVSDGADKGELRVWLDEVARAGDVAEAQDAEILRFALANSRGDLQKVIYATWKASGSVPWSTMMAKIAETLLTADEESFLRDQVSNMFQLRGETEPSYSQRFWDAVYKAWPPSQINQQILTMLISQFADSLREVQTRWHVKVNNPQTIEEAIRLANSSGRALGPPRVRRMEQDMEVGAVSSDRRGEKEVNTVRTLQGEIKSLAKKLQRCEEVGAARNEALQIDLRQAREYGNRHSEQRGEKVYWDGNNKGPSRRSEGDSRGRGRSMQCYLCGGPHLIRNCEQRASYNEWARGQASGSATQSAAQAGN